MAETIRRPEHDDLRDQIDRLLTADWEKAATRQNLGDLNFSSVLPTLNGLRRLLTFTAAGDLSVIPVQTIAGTSTELQMLLQWLANMRGFDILRGGIQQRDQIADEIQNSYSKLVNLLAGPITLDLVSKIDVDTISTSVVNSVRTEIIPSVDQSKVAAAHIETLRKQADDILGAMKDAAAKAGVSANATVFSEQASEHKNASERWMGMTIGAGILTVVWGAYMLWGLPINPAAPLPEIVQHAIAKLIVFSGLSYGLLWCARNYSANRHNYVLNKHRQNSLSTFETFAKAAEGDEDTKNAILIQATTSIFAAQTTGYLPKEPDIDQPSKIIEILRTTRTSG